MPRIAIIFVLGFCALVSHAGAADDSAARCGRVLPWSAIDAEIDGTPRSVAAHFARLRATYDKEWILALVIADRVRAERPNPFFRDALTQVERTVHRRGGGALALGAIERLRSQLSAPAFHSAASALAVSPWFESPQVPVEISSLIAGIESRDLSLDDSEWRAFVRGYARADGRPHSAASLEKWPELVYFQRSIVEMSLQILAELPAEKDFTSYSTADVLAALRKLPETLYVPALEEMKSMTPTARELKTAKDLLGTTDRSSRSAEFFRSYVTLLRQLGLTSDGGLARYAQLFYDFTHGN